MYLFSKLRISKTNYFNLLIFLFPLSFIAGNMIININILLVILSSLLLFGKDIFKVKFYVLDKLIFTYFFFILFTGIVNDIQFFLEGLAWEQYFPTIVKSLYFFKYLLLYIVLRYLVEKNFFQIKFFFLSCTLGAVFVSLDIFFQFFNGKDIFGFASSKNHLSGPFGDELIAGGYIQRFSIFSFFLIPFFYSKNLTKYLKYIIPILFIIFFTAIILSGNRMPLLLFLFSTFLIIVFQKETRKFFLPAIIASTIIFYIFINFNLKTKEIFFAFYNQISQMTVIVIKKDFENPKIPPYLREFSSFYETWLLNKYIGGGIKNFRYYCHHRNNIDRSSDFICNMHPHNYYLEILTETGIIGFSIVIVIFSLIIYLTLIKKYFFRSILNQNKLIIPFIFLFFVEIFPIKSTGSFFTTGNSTYLFILIGILIGLIRKDYSIENKS